MRRATLAVVLATAATLTGACSTSEADDRAVAPPAAENTGPLPSSQRFDTPFPVAGETWDATVTVSNLRIVPSYMYSDTVFAVDVRAVQSAGEPALGPADFTAYDPSGREFERIENPAGTVDDPLVPSTMTFPGEEIRGMVAWTMPPGARIGRIELSTERTIGSFIVTRQPVDPSQSSQS